MKAYLKKRITSQNKGVVMRGGKYIARMYVGNRLCHVGTYDTPEEASLAYERAKLSKNNVDNKHPKDVPTPESDPTTPETTPDATATACKKRKHRSYIGVFEKGAKFVAQIHTNNEKKELGIYDTPEEAARAFDLAVLERKFPASLLNYPTCKPAKKKALTAASSVNAQESKFVKHQQAVAHYDGEWLPVTIRDVLPNKYYNVHWTNSDEISSVHEDEITDPTSPADKAAALRARIAAAKSVSALAAQAKPKKKTKKTAAGQSSHSFPFGIPAPLVKSFNDFFEETCRVDFTNSKPSDSGLLMVGDVHKEYRAWCTKNKRPYCPERTSKEWERAPFVVNNRRADRLPPFRLLMFAKLDRLPRRVKDVYSSTETAWRRHKKSYVGHPYYQGLQWKDSFTPTLKYVHVKKKALSAVDMFDSITRGW